MDAEKRVNRALQESLRQLTQASPQIPNAVVALNKAAYEFNSLVSSWNPRCVRPMEEWANAFRDQAAVDLAAIDVLLKEKVVSSTVVMLFQMVFEKIAKAALARTNRNAFIACFKKHTAASRLVNLIKNQREFMKLRYKWKETLLIVQDLERAHPAIADRAHLEYPWEDANGVFVPESLQLVMKLGNPQSSWGMNAQRFAHELLAKFDSIFT